MRRLWLALAFILLGSSLTFAQVTTGPGTRQVTADRAPGPSDSCRPFDEWRDTSTTPDSFYKASSCAAGAAVWTLISGGSVSVNPDCVGTFAELPASPVTGDTCSVTDAPSTSDCSAGGGAAVALCLYNGATWDAISTAESVVTVLPQTPGAGNACGVNDRWLDTSVDPAVWYLPTSCTTDAEAWAPTTGPGVAQNIPTLEEVRTAGQTFTGAISEDTAVTYQGESGATCKEWIAGAIPVKQCRDPSGNPINFETQLSTGRYWSLLDNDQLTLLRINEDGTVAGTPSLTKSIWVHAASLDVDGTQCVQSTGVAIGSDGPTTTVVCSDNASGIMYTPWLRMPVGWDCGAVSASLTVADTTSAAEVYGVNFAGQVRSTAAISTTYGTASADSVATMTTSNIPYATSTQSFTSNGTCGDTGDDVLRVKAVIDAAGAHTDSSANVLGLLLRYTVNTWTD